jgi:hypothetical protein
VYRALAIALAVIAAIVPVSPRLVERAYSCGFYGAIQPFVTRWSNHAGIALLDVLIVVAAGALLARVALAVRSRRRGRVRSAGELLLSIGAAGAVLYLAFLVLWGWNYRRVPLTEKFAFDALQVSPDAVTAATRTAVAELNRLHAPAHAAGWTTPGPIDPALARAFATTQRLLGATRLATPARPKLTMLQPYFRRAGVSGMTDPYFLETLVDATLLPFERPLVVAHEWAHLAGYADEGEANFVGWLTCVRAREPEQYSGWLFMYDELLRSAPARDRAALRASVSPSVRQDLAAIADRLRKNINPALASAGWIVYDKYLKANRVAEGAASYDTVVRLVVGTQFDAGWVPVRR